jgi:outer membrane protein assembly factor BamB
LAEVATDRLPRLVFYSTCDLYDVRFDSSQSKCPSDAFGSAVHALATGALSPLEFIRGFGAEARPSVVITVHSLTFGIVVCSRNACCDKRALRRCESKRSCCQASSACGVAAAAACACRCCFNNLPSIIESDARRGVCQQLTQPVVLGCVQPNGRFRIPVLPCQVAECRPDETFSVLIACRYTCRAAAHHGGNVPDRHTSPPAISGLVQSGYCNVLSACSLFYPVWPNAGGDTRASGTSVWSVDVTSRLAVLWLSPESEKVLVTCGPIVVDSSAIAAGTAGGSLIALHPDSGNLLWTLHTGTGCKVVDARYVHNSNQLVVGTACGNLIAFDYWSHTVMWNVTLGASLATTPVHTADGSIWCAVEGSVVNVSPTGGISWSYQLTNDSVSSNIVAFTDGTITAGLTSGGLLSLKSRHARTTPLDSFRPVVHVCVSPLNTVIASDSAGYMFAVSGYSGKLLWRSAGPFTSPPSVLRDVVVVGSPEGLAALFVTNGTVAWQVAWTSQTRVQPTVSVTGHVVVALDDSSVAVVNASTGSFVWKSTLDNSLNLTSPVVIHADGTLYGVNSNQTLVSFAV